MRKNQVFYPHFYIFFIFFTKTFLLSEKMTEKSITGALFKENVNLKCNKNEKRCFFLFFYKLICVIFTKKENSSFFLI